MHHVRVTVRWLSDMSVHSAVQSVRWRLAECNSRCRARSCPCAGPQYDQRKGINFIQVRPCQHVRVPFIYLFLSQCPVAVQLGIFHRQRYHGLRLNLQCSRVVLVLNSLYIFYPLVTDDHHAAWSQTDRWCVKAHFRLLYLTMPRACCGGKKAISIVT